MEKRCREIGHEVLVFPRPGTLIRIDRNTKIKTKSIRKKEENSFNLDNQVTDNSVYEHWKAEGGGGAISGGTVNEDELQVQFYIRTLKRTCVIMYTTITVNGQTGFLQVIFYIYLCHHVIIILL